MINISSCKKSLLSHLESRLKDHFITIETIATNFVKRPVNKIAFLLLCRSRVWRLRMGPRSDEGMVEDRARTTYQRRNCGRGGRRGLEGLRRGTEAGWENKRCENGGSGHYDLVNVFSSSPHLTCIFPFHHGFSVFRKTATFPTAQLHA